jgi:hypothetical protein
MVASEVARTVGGSGEIALGLLLKPWLQCGAPNVPRCGQNMTMDAGGRDFHRFGFEPAYEVDLDPEFPSAGDWPCPVFGFDHDGRVVSEFVSRWGTPLIVRVAPANAAEWVGMFPADGLSGVEGVFAGPGPQQMCVLVGGQAYLVQVDVPEDAAVVAHFQVGQVVPALDPPLLLLVRFMDIVAIGTEGIAWRSPRLAVDDLRVLRADAGGVHCVGYLLGDSLQEFVVDPANGRVSAGARLDGPAWN